MPEVTCPAVSCTHNADKKCMSPELNLKFRIALDFPGKGTIVMYECIEQELPQDKVREG